MSRAVAYAGPSYPSTARIQKKGNGNRRPVKQAEPCELHPDAGTRTRGYREYCDECLREQDRRSNHARDARPEVPLLERVWK